MGLQLNSPLIAGSCGLTDQVKSIRDFEKAGAGAVVLKSIFEEDINLEYDSILSEADQMGYLQEDLDYYDYKIKEKNIKAYLGLISSCKKSVTIPVIASVNCISSYEWSNFVVKCEEAGADGLELNIFIMPSGLNSKSEEIESRYFDIIHQVLKKVSIPVGIKISPYFTSLGTQIKNLSSTGIAALTLFNRFYNPDFDIDQLKITSSNVFSKPSDMSLPLRWIALMSGRVDCDLAASTGVHDGEALVKQMLAGAQAVQVVSALYNNGSEQLKLMLGFLKSWMQKHQFNSLHEFRGLLSQSAGKDPALYERVQFMKFFSGKF